jgi:hypothetical protein
VQSISELFLRFKVADTHFMDEKPAFKKSYKTGMNREERNRLAHKEIREGLDNHQQTVESARKNLQFGQIN